MLANLTNSTHIYRPIKRSKKQTKWSDVLFCDWTYKIMIHGGTCSLRIPYHVSCQHDITTAKHTIARSMEAETKEKRDEGTPETRDPTQRSLHKTPKKSHAYADEW